jgi:hypothetical protein
MILFGCSTAQDGEHPTDVVMHPPELSNLIA